jgi:hypothetical protein
MGILQKMNEFGFTTAGRKLQSDLNNRNPEMLRRNGVGRNAASKWGWTPCRPNCLVVAQQ